MSLGAWRVLRLTLAEGAGAAVLAFLLYYLAASGVETSSDAWSSERMVAYLLLFLAPLLIFLPLSLTLDLGPVWLLGAGSWGLLGFVLAFVGPPQREESTLMTYVAFLNIVFVALASALSLPMAALGKRFLPTANRLRGFTMSLRQGFLLSLFCVSLMAMSPLGVLNWLNALLVFSIIALTEFFFISRG